MWVYANCRYFSLDSADEDVFRLLTAVATFKGLLADHAACMAGEPADVAMAQVKDSGSAADQ